MKSDNCIKCGKPLAQDDFVYSGVMCWDCFCDDIREAKHQIGFSTKLKDNKKLRLLQEIDWLLKRLAKDYAKDI